MSDKTSAPRIEFNCGGNSSPAYSCNKPGDNSGTYVQATDYDEVVNRVKVQREALETALTSMLDSGYSQDSVAIKLIKQALEADNG